jgi:M6 family metalloprotease-like protein
MAAVCATGVATAVVAIAVTDAGSGAVVRSPCAPPPHAGPGVSEGINDPQTMPPTRGDVRIAMLFMDFPDAPGIEDPIAIHGSYAREVVDWFDTVSYGRLRLVIEPLRRWLRLPQPSATYAASGRGIDAAAEDAIALADTEFDFRGFHAIYVVPSRDAAFPTLGVRLFGPRPIEADGAALRAVAWLFTDNLAPNAPYVIHETGHVLGLPDLYFPRAFSTFNHWDAMATGGTIGVAGGMYAWHRWKLGWLDDAQIACLPRVGRRTARVTPLEHPGGVKAVVVRAGQTAFVAEVRQRLAEDRGICQKGVLVFSVDLRPPLRGGPSRGAIRIQSDRFDDLRRWRRCGGRWNATLDVGRGRDSRLRIGKVSFQVLAALPDGSYRIRATRRK